ncbi:N-acetylmuramoyl-L-alanine amidase [Ekhidna sp.]|uniref:N-acetylmuramoyl-L-alanine amidase n=1 Tax=Ekhidna sp. TaxID=2608089 RepID=UPI003CCBDA1A
MKQKLIFLTLLVSSFAVDGQKLIYKSPFVESYQTQSSDTVFTLRSIDFITAIAIKSDREGLFKIIGNNELHIPRDADVSTPTYFLSLPQPTKSLIIQAPRGYDYTIFLITSGTAPPINSSKFRRQQSAPCEEPPPSVPQETWRSGLPEPNYSRSFHEVFHNVVHHSAGSNSNMNYTQVVRDIYLYHTQVNGWSDIGYNYLIAQDGTLYAGRDPGNGSQDQVRGAHFCGANSNTLGVCLLGNYETASPTSVSIETLKSLLTYQLYSQEGDPFQSYNHPLGNLGTVIGHRDGCSTLCPGENVYSMLNGIRSNVSNELDACAVSEPLVVIADTTLIEVQEQLTLSANGSYDEFIWILPGGIPGKINGETVYVSYARPGFFDVTVVGRTGSITDTLQLTNYIQVSTLKDEPVVFPNPVQAFEELTIDFKEKIVNSRLLDINGKTIESWQQTRFEMGGIESGIYILDIETQNQRFKKRIVVQ